MRLPFSLYLLRDTLGSLHRNLSAPPFLFFLRTHPADPLADHLHQIWQLLCSTHYSHYQPNSLLAICTICTTDYLHSPRPHILHLIPPHIKQPPITCQHSEVVSVRAISWIHVFLPLITIISGPPVLLQLGMDLRAFKHPRIHNVMRILRTKLAITVQRRAGVCSAHLQFTTFACATKPACNKESCMHCEGAYIPRPPMSLMSLLFVSFLFTWYRSSPLPRLRQKSLRTCLVKSYPPTRPRHETGVMPRHANINTHTHESRLISDV